MTACRGCGRPIVWGVTLDGKKIPLDPRPPIYQVITAPDGQVLAQLQKPGSNVLGAKLEYMVSHFATCPKASQFSGKNKHSIGGAE